jgi:hypothetical protein
MRMECDFCGAETGYAIVFSADANQNNTELIYPISFNLFIVSVVT